MSHGLLLVFELTILVLAIFLGFEVISKVPTLLHTPLMSGTNAIHGIVIVGAMLVAGLGHKDTLTTVVGLVAVVLASANVVGEERNRSARMKQMIVTRYARLLAVWLTRAPRRRRLPPGAARLRRRLTPLAAQNSPGP